MGKKIKFDELMKNLHQYDVLVVKSLYHININMVVCWGYIRRILDAGVELVSLDEGILTVLDDREWFEKNLKVAIYDRSRTTHGYIAVWNSKVLFWRI